jgi:foldase protein PrsA
MVLSACSLVKKNPQAAANSVVAVVGGEQIKKAEFDQMFEMFKVQYEQQYGADVWNKEVDGRKYIDVMKEKVLDMLVDIKVEEQEAKKAGLTATDDEVNAEVTKARQYFDSDQKFNDFLTSQKLTLDSLKDTIRKDILTRKLQDKLTANVQVTDDEVAAYYAANQAQFQSVKASQILLATEDEAKKMLERIKNGESINDLAVQYSKDPTAKENKGELGYFKRGEMVPEFENAAFKMKPGEISEPVKTDYGYHIIKVEDIKIDKLEDVKDELKTQLLDQKKSQAFQDLLTQMRSKANVKTYPKNL